MDLNQRIKIKCRIFKDEEKTRRLQRKVPDSGRIDVLSLLLLLWLQL
jgi:ribosomal protein S28E/S33